MRLGTCVAIELGVFATLASGLMAGGAWALSAYKATLVAPAPAALLVKTTPFASLGALPSARRSAASAEEPILEPLEELPPPGESKKTTAFWQNGSFEGRPDRELLEALRKGTLTRASFNRGGSSISLRLDFDNGSRAAFKPRQTNYQTIPRREVAAYRISRLLGLSSVQPALGRSFRASELLAAFTARSQKSLARFKAEAVIRKGLVIGELSWWIPVVRRARVQGFAVDSTDGIITWKRMLSIRGKIPPQAQVMVQQISHLLLFDFLINNMDRWSGGNTKMSADGKRLYFMDNTLSFGNHPRGHRRVRTYLQRAQRFSRRLVAALRNLQKEAIRAALAEDLGPFDKLLSKVEIHALWKRREYALRYIDELINQFGEPAVLKFP